MSSDRSLPLVIVNPVSAGGSTESRWAKIASELATHFGAFNVEFTGAPQDAIRIAREESLAGRKFIIACGGDGTINETVNGILESGKDVELGIFPSGTGGDFRRTIEMPTSTRECARALRDGETKLIDVGKVSFNDHEAKRVSRFFVNVSSFGLSASVIGRVKGQNKLDWMPIEKLRGTASFAVSTLQEVFDIETATVRISVDDEEERVLNTVNFCVANSRFFGGGMKIAPDAKLNDGLFDVVNIGDITTARILFNAHKLFNGTHLALDEVKHRNAKKISVRPFSDDQTIFLETDGELPGRLPALYELVPSAIRVRIPKANFA